VITDNTNLVQGKEDEFQTLMMKVAVIIICVAFLVLVVFIVIAFTRSECDDYKHHRNLWRYVRVNGLALFITPALAIFCICPDLLLQMC
jgi:hypothetical protein